MKKVFLAIGFLLSVVSVHAQNIKLYIADAENGPYYQNNIFMQAIVCNNTYDTIFVRRQDLDNIYPAITNDASVIVDGGSKLFISNAKEIPENTMNLVSNIPERHNEDMKEMQSRQQRQRQANEKLEQIMSGGQIYFVIAPQKCITLSSTLQVLDTELLKLYNLDKEEQKNIDVYLTIPLTYYTDKDKSLAHKQLISRSSSALQKAVLVYNK